MLRSKRGLALITVLIIVSLLVGMLGTLFGVHRDHLVVARISDQKLVAHQACNSAVNYACERLRSDDTWGNLAWGSSQIRFSIPEQLEIREAGATTAENCVTGKLPDSTFKMRVLNNLAATTPVSAVGLGHRSSPVPPGSALLVVEARAGSATQYAEVLVRRTPPLGATLISAGDIGFKPTDPSQARLTFKSVDATKNAIRSNGQIILPQADKVNFGVLVNSGMASGKKDVVVGGSISVDAQGQIAGISGGTSLKAVPGARKGFEAITNGQLPVGREVQLVDLEPDDFPTAAGPKRVLPGGRYRFTAPGQVDYYPPGSSIVAQSYSGAIFAGGASSGPTGEEVVVLRDSKFMVVGQAESSEGLELESAIPATQAELALGYNTLEGGAGDLTARSSLRILGDLKIKGHLLGQGTLVTEARGFQAGNLQISGCSLLSRGSQTGLTVYAEGQVRMTPPEDTHDVTLAADFEAFRLGAPTSTRAAELESFLTLPDDGPTGRDSLMGKDDRATFVAGGSTPLRDTLISASDYQDRVIPLIPNWPTLTPGGTALPPQATEFVRNCLAGAGGWSQPGMTVGRHTRLMAYMRSVDSLGASGDLNWLMPDSDPYNLYVRGILKDQAMRYCQDSSKRGYPSLMALLQGPNLYADPSLSKRDIRWTGFIYSKTGLWARGNTAFDLVGALCTQGSLVFENINRMNFMFDDYYLKDALNPSALPTEATSWYFE